MPDARSQDASYSQERDASAIKVCFKAFGCQDSEPGPGCDCCHGYHAEGCRVAPPYPQSLKQNDPSKRSLYLMHSSHTSAHLQKKSTCFSTLTFITNARTTMPFARLHSQMVCTQSEPAEIPQHMFVQILVQVGGDRKRQGDRKTHVHIYTLAHDAHAHVHTHTLSLFLTFPLHGPNKICSCNARGCSWVRPACS